MVLFPVRRCLFNREGGPKSRYIWEIKISSKVFYIVFVLYGRVYKMAVIPEQLISDFCQNP